MDLDSGPGVHFSGMDRVRLDVQPRLAVHKSIEPMPNVLDRFIPDPDVCERHATTVHAPAELVFETARNFDLQSITVVRAIFSLRAKLLRSRAALPQRTGIVALTQSLGWGVLLDQPGVYVSGARCQPWLAEVIFSAIAADEFAAYAEPNQVKIVWSLEANETEPGRTLLCTETRAIATDERARVRFRRYWRVFGVGIVMIRRLLLSAVRRKAARQYRFSRG